MTATDAIQTAIHCTTMNGTVHLAAIAKVGDRTLIAPTCRKYRIDQLHYVQATTAPVTCKNCLRKLAAR